MIYHQNGRPSLSFIRQTLNTYYYATGYPCTYIPFDQKHLFSTQIGMPEPFLQNSETMHILAHIDTNKSFCKIWQQGETTYLTYPLIHKKTYHGLMLADISQSHTMQHHSLQNMFTICIQNNTVIEKTEAQGLDGSIENPFTSNNHIKHHPYHLEKSHMQQMILTGEINADIYNDYVMPVLGLDELRSIKNHTIIAISLLARSAINLGLDAHSAFSISDHYILAIELTDNPTDLQAYQNRAIMEYHRHISERKDSRPPIVEAMVHYINDHLHEKISLATFTTSTDYSYTYLSGLFKKTIGSSFTDYVHTNKVEQSCNLLKDTSYSIQMVSDHYGYSYPYQYINAFKKIMGVTPGAYRKILQAE